MADLRTWRRRAAPVLLGAAAAAALWLAGGADLAWRAIAGPPDLGPIDLSTLERRSVPNDALACPPELCTAQGDIAPPRWPVPAAELRRAFAAAIAGEPRVERVSADDRSMTDRWVQRTTLMRFPDTIVARFVDLPEGGSTVILYSRSQLGSNDLGVNRARIERWLQRLRDTVPSGDPPAAGTRPSATPPAAVSGSH